MSNNGLSIKKALPLIALAWILSLVTTLALVYFSPSIFPPLGPQNIADEAITASKISDGAIVTLKLSDGSVTSAKILDGSITTVDLIDGSVTSIKIADGAVTGEKITNDSISESKVAEGAIVTAKLSDGAVTSAKILDGTITTQDLEDGAIISVKIADGAITTSKIADGAITDKKLAADAIPYFATYNGALASTNSTSFVDIPETILTVSVNRKSNLIIMFSAEAWVDGAGDSLFVRALVDSTVANPNSGSLTLLTTAGESQHGSYAINFYMEDVAAGTYTVKIQWSELLGAQLAHMGDRTLNVIALPA
jgi:hypothetical protein